VSVLMPGLWRDVVDESTLVGRLGLEDLAGAREQVAHGGQGEAVDHLPTLAALGDQAAQAQDGELVGQARGLDVDRGEQLVDGPVALGQQLEDADAGRVAERSEELGLGLVQRNRHVIALSCRIAELCKSISLAAMVYRRCPGRGARGAVERAVGPPAWIERFRWGVRGAVERAVGLPGASPTRQMADLGREPPDAAARFPRWRAPGIPLTRHDTQDL